MSYLSENQPLGTPTWTDLGVPDLERALQFYGAVFGWDFEIGPDEYGRYTMCFLRGRRVAAISEMQDPSTRGFWNVYLATDDVDATAAKVEEAGGKVEAGPFDVMEHGRMVAIQDPTGARVSLWQARKHIGTARANEPGTPIWNELVTPMPRMSP